jgi:nucleotide-binding universal stress UspA family protein
MFKKILLAMDGSEPSKHALKYALEIVKKWDSELLILSVVPTIVLPVFTTWMPAEDIKKQQDDIEKHYQNVLTYAEKEVQKYSEIPHKTILEFGRPCIKINEVASEENIDLIIVGSSGLGGITGYLLGSTSHRVADNCKTPILIIK